MLYRVFINSLIPGRPEGKQAGPEKLCGCRKRLLYRRPLRFFRLGENPQLAYMSCLIYMKKNLLSALLLGTAALGYAQPSRPTEATAREYAATITAEELSKHLRIIAADSMQGRDTGSEGQKMAADYIASQFFDASVKPVIKFPDGAEGYYQEFELVRRMPAVASLETGTQRRESPRDFLAQGIHQTVPATTLEVVFAGYGIESERYSDYAGLDVQGKAVLIFAGEPVGKRGKRLVTGTTSASEWSTTTLKKAELARQKGARAVFILYPDQSPEQFSQSLKTAWQGPSLKLKYKAAAQQNAPVFTVSRELAAEIIGISEKTLLRQQRKIARRKKPVRLPNATVTWSAQVDEETVSSENVIGMVPGTDKKDEIIVVSAHYDHVGVQNGQVYNGADDDGSGTVAVLEIAQAFARARSDGFGPRRSIVFMTVSGEEKGLLGSEFYTAHPLFPLQNTVANLNIDMIGRLDEAHQGNPNYVYLIGSDKLSSELHAISEEANRQFTNLQLDYKYNDPADPNRFYYRSDHYNFAKHKIPVIFYFNGVHADYHQPTDDVEKIDFNKIEKIARLVFFTAWDVANREQRLKVDSFKQ
jgi:Zn-dependent M28 family amino/carboxypeptidase